ncbi:MAG: hypothetical protein L0I76_07780 [Pseudonocardia sp.]|nr:hypothetical protein [Pseudonocardia sp.]
MSDTEPARPQGAAPPEEQDRNQKMIAEFRENHGRLSGPFDGPWSCSCTTSARRPAPRGSTR